jgi:hypothetical protein
MPEIQVPVDLGFTEFVTTLLTEVVTSIVAAQSDQEQRMADLAAAAELPPEEFATVRVTDDDVDALLAVLFPARDDGRAHDAVSGSPYRPAGEGVDEEPPFAARLGVVLEGRDFNADRGTLLARGASKVRAAARQRLADQQQRAVQALVEQGIPRVLVDAGRISAKITFEALQYRDEDGAARPAAASEGTQGPLLGAQDVVMIGRLPLVNVTAVMPQVLRDVRMRVRTADEARGTTRTNVYGEVELTFKTLR